MPSAGLDTSLTVSGSQIRLGRLGEQFSDAWPVRPVAAVVDSQCSSALLGVPAALFNWHYAAERVDRA